MKQCKKFYLKVIAIFTLLLGGVISLNGEPMWNVNGKGEIQITLTDFREGDLITGQAKLVAIPDGYIPTVTVIGLDSVIYPADVLLDIKQDLKTEDNQSIASFGEPARMRGITVATLIIKPLRFDKNTDQIICYHNIDLKVDNLTSYRPLKVSSAFDLLYRNTILNYESPGLIEPQGYLIIVPDEFYNNILPLARWKEQKGW